MLTTWIAYLLLILFFALEPLLRKGPAARSLQAARDDRASTRLIGICLILLLLLSVFLNLAGWGRFRNPHVSYIGLSLMAAGLLLRSWAMQTLSQHYTRTLQTDSSQLLVRRGPYRLVRHPGYLGTLLVWCTAGLAMQNILLFIFSALLAIPVYAYRIQQEETLLVKQFGDSYLAYQRRSWKLLPPLW
ncbi:MAG TPA: isoprenylcysteine carboxylmethyltransferase family protein [Chitinophagaceae bacterium]|nr:isoprenylcysteine carboxylmethyltransferase family protein [Chitinophagaceae bacterium]